jgi:hypothetical protein
MTSYAVDLQRLDSVPLAVIRRQARALELARLVPECCGLVWDAVRAQQAHAGRHVAIYWDGSIRLEVGVRASRTVCRAGRGRSLGNPCWRSGSGNALRALRWARRRARRRSPVV